MTSCHIWRDHPKSGPARYVFGEMVAFSRIGGSAGESYDFSDPTFSRDAHPWRTGLEGRAEVSARDYRVKRTCGNKSHVYVGEFAENTIKRADFEKLFEQWIRAQAERDGCPVRG